jgi:hypothetical protein
VHDEKLLRFKVGDFNKAMDVPVLKIFYFQYPMRQTKPSLRRRKYSGCTSLGSCTNLGRDFGAWVAGTGVLSRC